MVLIVFWFVWGFFFCVCVCVCVRGGGGKECSYKCIHISRRMYERFGHVFLSGVVDIFQQYL